MEVRKGYKRTEVGVIPEDWCLPELHELGTFHKGKGIKKTEVKEVGIDCIRYGQLYTLYRESTTNPVSKISPETAKDSFKLETGDVLFAGSGETKEDIGKSTVFLGEREAYAGGDIVVLRPSGEYGSFLGYATNSEVANRQKTMGAQGDAVVHIYKSSLSKLKIPLPPTKTEQRAIATALSEADAYVAALEALIAKKRQVKQGVMKEVLTPGEGWREVPLGEVCEFIGDGTHQTPIYVDAGINFLSVENVTSGEFEKTKFVTQEEYDKYAYYSKTEVGDILITRIGTLGKTAMVTWSYPSAIYVSLALLRIKDEAIRNWVYAYTKSDFFIARVENRSLMRAIPQKINLGELGKVLVPLPPKPEQTRIATLLTDLDEELIALETQLAKARSVKTGMLADLLTGRVRLV